MRLFFTGVTFLLLYAVTATGQTWLWGRGNTGSGVDGWAVAIDPAGNVFAAGINFDPYQVAFGTTVIPNAGSGAFQCVLVKYDVNGNVLWATGTQNGDTYLINIAADKAGNVVLFGSFKSQTVQVGTHTLTNSVFPNAQYFIAKYDPAGNVLWTVNAGSAQFSYVSLGSMAVVLTTGGVATDATGNIYITANYRMPVISVGGHSLINANAAGTTNDILMAKYDPAGNVLWSATAGSTGDDEAYGLTVTTAGDVYIAGVFDSPTLTFGASVIANPGGAKTAFIARFDAAGNPVWGCGSGGTGGEYAVGLAADNTNNVYLTGGLKDHSISFNGTTIINPDTIPVLYLAKFDPLNNVSWYKTIGSVKDSGLGAWGYSIAVSQCGQVWVSGCMNDDIDVDGHILLRPQFSSDPIFMAGYTATGTYIGATALQSGGDDQNGIACDDSGHVYMSCDYETYPFQIGSDAFPAPTTATGELLFVGKYSAASQASKDPTCTKTDVCLNGLVTLNAQGSYINYTWNDGRKGAKRTVSDTGVFWVTGFDTCVNSTVDTFSVTTACDCQKSLFVPNSFTPNADGVNDVFYPRCGVNVKIIKTFRVYNRWGELLFDREQLTPNDVTAAWDGTYNNNLSLPDVYVWLMDAVCENGNVVSRKGSVTVIR
jgi:gliding motility-associated-like protein